MYAWLNRLNRSNQVKSKCKLQYNTELLIDMSNYYLFFQVELMYTR